MMTPRLRGNPRRPAIILFVVVAFLGLGLSIGIAFVFYANQMATSMRFQREAAQGGRAERFTPVTRGNDGEESPPQPTVLASSALGQLIYDLPDDESGTGSSLRGASLARAMYGLFYSGTPNAPSYQLNDVPYNGIGRCRPSSGAYSPSLISAIDHGEYRAVNYTYFAKDGFVRDPERIGYRNTPADAAWRYGSTNYFPLNAPYTYPDEKDIYLAAVRSRDGRVLVPSFYRPSAFGSLAPSNPNWKTEAGKYLIHRPRPIDMGPGFPAVPANPDGTYTGDVEQLEGKLVRQNDSLWLDLDFPVQKWRGRTYKPLVAMLVVDLDGRINVNVAGNRRGLGDKHASNHGLGAWEIDLQQIFQFNEANKLFIDANGRYGADKTPNRLYAPEGTSLGINQATPPGSSPFFAAIDFDGSVLTQPGPTLRMQVPKAPSTRTSPNFPPRYAGGSIEERTDHPSLYNPYLINASAGTSSSGDRVFDATEMRRLNSRFNGGTADFARSDLSRLLPQNLGRNFTPGKDGWSASAANPRFLMTTISNDLDRPGLSPWIFDQRTTYVQQPPAPVNNVYPPAQPPAANGVSFPDLSRRSSTSNSADNVQDFDPLTWKATLATIGTVDVNRPLADYRSDPAQSYEKVGNVTAQSAQRAWSDRQRLAHDIFDRLCIATGTRLKGTAPGTPEYHALRYLAQLAVNIVDQRDEDDCITPFVWNPLDAADPTNAANFTRSNLSQRVVFGTELPRLVINEAACRVENGSLLPGHPDHDPGLFPALLPKATFYNVKIWAELHNPLTPGLSNPESLSFGGGAPLKFDGHQVYRMLLSEPNGKLRHVENVKGDPDGKIRSTVDLPEGNYRANEGVIPPSNGSYIQPLGTQSSFYLIGPEVAPGDLVVPSALDDGMKYRIKPEDYQDKKGARTTLLLQRLACPQLPAGPDNPFITVDLMEFDSEMINDARLFNENGLIIPPPLSTILQKSWGRKQPFAGHRSQVVSQNVIPAPIAGIHHTFFRHNGQGQTLLEAGLTLTQPFDWMVHFDRAFTSSAELMYVSAWKPHELTQQFAIGEEDNRRPYQHAADWTSDTGRLHRALALLRVRDRTVGLGIGGRVPGRVNINTVWDEEIWQAVAAAGNGNAFTSTDAKTAWQKLLQQRTPSGAPSGALDRDRPIMGFAGPIESSTSSQYPAGAGINRTLLASDPTDPSARLIDVPRQDHPYLRNEMFGKVVDRLTTRSNTFAIWMTVGYFEVTDRFARPIKLGKEVGIEDGTNVRHRFFAIVDRTNLATDPGNPRLQGRPPVFFSYEPTPGVMGADPVTPGTVTAIIPATAWNGSILRGIYDGMAWDLQSNDSLLVDVGPNQERVPIRIVGFTPGIGASVQMNFVKAHDRGCPMMIGKTQLGNPGPQPGFHVGDSRYSGVVRFFGSVD